MVAVLSEKLVAVSRLHDKERQAAIQISKDVFLQLNDVNAMMLSRFAFTKEASAKTAIRTKIVPVSNEQLKALQRATSQDIASLIQDPL